MAGETLLTLSEIIASFPDNTANLITPLQSRDLAISQAVAVGFFEQAAADEPLLMPMADGVPFDMLAAFTLPDFVGNFWKLDGNNAFIPSYTDDGITVNPPTNRLVQGSVVMVATKVGGGTGDYIFEGTENGIGTGSPRTVTLDANPSLLVFGGDRLYDINLANPIGLDVTPSGTSDDITIQNFRVTLTGTLV